MTGVQTCALPISAAFTRATFVAIPPAVSPRRAGIDPSDAPPVRGKGFLEIVLAGVDRFGIDHRSALADRGGGLQHRGTTAHRRGVNEDGFQGASHIPGVRASTVPSQNNFFSRNSRIPHFLLAFQGLARRPAGFSRKLLEIREDRAPSSAGWSLHRSTVSTCAIE